MRVLPIGTVTFVFTDIEGSTSMLQRLGRDLYVDVLETHNELLRESFAQGTEISSEGDAFFFVFTAAADALKGAVVAQQALVSHPWPDGGSVRVRIGLHTGEAKVGGDDYVGLDVHRAARIAAAGHGGQVLVSEATRAATSSQDAGVSLSDLGKHHFKDLDEPQHIYQLVIPGVPSDYPPVRSLDSRPNNLPSQSSQFVGRTKEALEVAELLDRSRLVTLTGPSGTGKTRLAIHVASQAVGRFAGGVVYVPLDGIRSANLVVGAIAERLGLQDDAVDSLLNTVAGSLSRSATLLVLDNFEHILPAAQDVGHLVEQTAELRVLVTSQAILRLRGEHVYPVLPLAPAEAIQLFTLRATAADPNFVVGADVEADVSALVARLEAVPLAIELAAARVHVLGVRGVLDHISDRLDLDGSPGPVDAPERHRTLGAAIGWSYQLLTPEEQSLLRQLSVFDGGFVFEAAERVVSPKVGIVASDGVASLLDKSFLQRRVVSGQARFSMLGSIRQFAMQRLEEAGERSAAERLHGTYYADLAEQALLLLEGPSVDVWLDRFSAEHDNLRAVVHRSLERNDPDCGLRTVGNAWRFYHRRGHLVEAQTALQALLASDNVSPAAKSTGMSGLAAVTYWLGDYQAALRQYLELLYLSRELGDRLMEAETLFALSTTSSFLNDFEEGIRYAELAKEAYEDAGAVDEVRRVLSAHAIAVWVSGDLPEAERRWQEVTMVYEEAGDRGEALQSRAGVAAIAHQLGRTDEALQKLGEILGEMAAMGDITGTLMVLDTISMVLASRDPERAIRLAGAAAAMREDLGGGFTLESFGFPTAREVAADRMAEPALESLWVEGSRLDLDAATELGREITGMPSDGATRADIRTKD